MQSRWDVAEPFTHAALVAHGFGGRTGGLRYAGSLRRNFDCDAVYRLLEEGLWWSLLEGKRLVIVSNRADEMAAPLTDESLVQAGGGHGVSWSVEAIAFCPAKSVPKRDHWPRMRDELFAAEWTLLLCSAGSLSANVCEHDRNALDIGALDQVLLACFEGVVKGPPHCGA